MDKKILWSMEGEIFGFENGANYDVQVILFCNIYFWAAESGSIFSKSYFCKVICNKAQAEFGLFHTAITKNTTLYYLSSNITWEAYALGHPYPCKEFVLCQKAPHVLLLPENIFTSTSINIFTLTLIRSIWVKSYL